MIFLIALHLALTLFNAPVWASDCRPDLVPFVDRLRCEGQTVDRVSGKTIGVTIDLNLVYHEVENAGSPKRVINAHAIHLKQPVLKWFSTSSATRFMETWAPMCRRDGTVVRCAGAHDGERFEATVNLTTMRAHASYVDDRYPNPEFHRELNFDEANVLECR